MDKTLKALLRAAQAEAKGTDNPNKIKVQVSMGPELLRLMAAISAHRRSAGVQPFTRTGVYSEALLAWAKKEVENGTA